MPAYLLLFLGGYLADRWFGRYWTIVGFSIPYVLGTSSWGSRTPRHWRSLLVVGRRKRRHQAEYLERSLGQTYDEQRPGQDQLRSAAFLWFYFAINFGALISQLALPALRNNYGYAIAFQFPAWVMIASLMVFALGKPYYASERVVTLPLTAEERRQRWQTLRKLFGIFGLIIFFWVGYEHNDSIWVIFARDYIDLQVPWRSNPLSRDQLQFFNPLCVLIFAPLLAWLFRVIDPHTRVFTATKRILLGFIGGHSGNRLDVCRVSGSVDGRKVSIFWMWQPTCYCRSAKSLSTAPVSIWPMPPLLKITRVLLQPAS